MLPLLYLHKKYATLTWLNIKTGEMKMKFFLPYTAMVLCLLTGCMLPEQQGAAKYLPASDICYSVTDQSTLFRNLNAAADRLQLSIMQSDLPEQQKRENLILLAAVRLAAIHCGLNETLSSGTSSTRIDGQEPRFNTTRVLAAAPGNAGVLWHCLSAGTLDIKETLARLPADTELAAAVRLETTGICTPLRGTARPLFPDREFSGIEKWAESLSGTWLLSGRAGESGICLELRIPDRNGTVSTWLRSQLPFQEDGVWLKTLEQQQLPFSVQLLPGEILLVAGEPLPVPEDGSLLLHPEIQKRLQFLPQKGAGLVYLSCQAENSFFLGENRWDNIRMTPEILGVLSAKPDALILNSISDWDPASENILLPLLWKKPFPFFADGLKIGKLARNSILVRQESEECSGRMQPIKKALFTFAAKNGGKFPEKNDVEGLRELLQTGLLKPEDLICPAATGDSPAADAGSFSPDNCSYIYVGGSTGQTPADFPLVMDWPLTHKARFQVLTAGGEIRTIHAGELDSCRKMVSILQSNHLYPEKDFRRLLEVADKLDSIFLKGHSK